MKIDLYVKLIIVKIKSSCTRFPIMTIDIDPKILQKKLYESTNSKNKHIYIFGFDKNIMSFKNFYTLIHPEFVSNSPPSTVWYMLCYVHNYIVYHFKIYFIYDKRFLRV